MQCTGTSKQSRNQCKRDATPGWEVCAIHGSKTPRGIASPHFKTGRYSKVMPTQLMEHYEAAQKDPDLLGIQQDIVLQDSLIFGALDAMSRGEAGELWKDLDTAWKNYKKAERDKNKPNAQNPEDFLAEIGFLIKEGYQDYMARVELRQMLQERAKLVDAEGKRLERAQQTLTTNQAMVLVQGLLQAVLESVEDPAIRNRIQGRFVQIIGLPNR